LKKFKKNFTQLAIQNFSQQVLEKCVERGSEVRYIFLYLTLESNKRLFWDLAKRKCDEKHDEKQAQYLYRIENPLKTVKPGRPRYDANFDFEEHLLRKRKDDQI